MKTTITLLSLVILFSYITITGCQDKPIILSDKIEYYKFSATDTACLLVIDSIKGESNLNPNDTICLKCMPVDTPMVDKCLGIFYTKYLSPAEGTIFAIRKIRDCGPCTIADTLKKFRKKM